jgi:hypothetical protein
MSLSKILNSIDPNRIIASLNKAKATNRLRSQVENLKQDQAVAFEIQTLPFKKFNAAQSAIAKV